MKFVEQLLKNLKLYVQNKTFYLKSVGAAKGDEKAALLENAKELATKVKEADSKRAEVEEESKQVNHAAFKHS
jgi:hypothetical protein